MTFYTGDRFEGWKGNLLVGFLQGRHVERFVFEDDGRLTRTVHYLQDLNERIRDVRQGPDELVYVLTDANPGAVLRIEPTP